MRKVILHYHLFKNAGTSLDAAFKENFSEEKGEWVTKEFPNQPAANRKQVRQWILDNPQAKCFSSHTALFPVPEFDDIEVFPVIFLRNPIDRIASAYSFEAKQNNVGFGSTLARNTSLKGYIETRLALPNDFQCRNFHAHRLSTMFEGNSLELAIKAMNSLPFIGLVEKFSESLIALEEALRFHGLESVNLNVVKRNVSRPPKAMDKKLDDIRNQIGSELYERLLAENEIDLQLYETLADSI